MQLGKRLLFWNLTQYHCVPGPCIGELVIRVVDEHHRVNPLAKGTVGREDNIEIEVFREGVQRVGLGRC
jgi:hypothetical protein